MTTVLDLEPDREFALDTGADVASTAGPSCFDFDTSLFTIVTCQFVHAGCI
jgi:hypothetical protein